MSMEQWVNLPRRSKYVKDKIKKIRRLNFVRFVVKFKKKGLAGYKLEIKKIGGNAFENYRASERRRNDNFKVRGAPKVLTNKGKTENKYTYDVFLNAAGDNEYEISATHKGKTVTGKLKYKSRRKLFYQVMKMRGCPTTSMTKMETEFWRPARKHYIEMKKKGAESTVKFISCLDDSNDKKFIKESAKGYTLKRYKPYAFGMTFVNYIATPEIVTFTSTLSNVTLPSKTSKWSTDFKEWTITLDRHVWFELDPMDDVKKRWLREIRLWFVPDDNPAAKEYVYIYDWMVNPTGPKKNALGGRKKLIITFPQNKIKRNLFTVRKGKWIASSKIMCVKGFSGGFAYTGVNLIAICTKSWWKTKNLASVPQTVVHEVGHMVGMVAHGDRAAYGDTARKRESSRIRKVVLPNGHANLYGDIRGTNDQDHAGPHCTKGAAFDATKRRGRRWSGSPACTMFGATGIGRNKAPLGFCSDCSKIVRKLDLSGSALKLGGFKVSMDDY